MSACSTRWCRLIFRKQPTLLSGIKNLISLDQRFWDSSCYLSQLPSSAFYATIDYYEKIVNWYCSYDIAIIIWHIHGLGYTKPNVKLIKKNPTTKS